jgi:hypothetical protein
MINGKVFCIGMFRTGTTSLSNSLEIIGYTVSSLPWWNPFNLTPMIFDVWYENPNEWDMYIPKLKEYTLQYDSFSDYPWMFLYDKCYEWYPNSKFILTVRDPEELAESEYRWWNYHNIPLHKFPPKSKFIDRYINHYNSVIAFFENKNNFLQMNIFEGDEWDVLCEFLNKDVPSVKFPQLNRTL